MIDNYTDEEIADSRQRWIDRLEQIWGEYNDPGFYIKISDGTILCLFSDGEVLCYKGQGKKRKRITGEYAKRFSLKTNGAYLAKSHALKHHLIKLIKAYDSKLF